MGLEEGDTARESDGEEEQASERDTAAEVPREDSTKGTMMEKKKMKVAPVKKGGKRIGVCYLSRIPPHMKPLKLRHLLSQFEEVSRVYLVPEDPAATMRRKRAGGNSGKNFTEEFVHKRDATRIAAILNGESMEKRYGKDWRTVDTAGVENMEKIDAKKPRFIRHFTQRRSVADPVLESQPGLSLDVLGAVFGKSSK